MTTFAILILVFIILAIPFFVHASTCRHCVHQKDCEKLMSDGELPPCIRDQHLFSDNYDI